MRKATQMMHVQVESPEWGILKLQLNVTYVVSTSFDYGRVQDFVYTIVSAKDETDTTIILSVDEKMNLQNEINTEILRQL
jgi:hypothetical protein